MVSNNIILAITKSMPDYLKYHCKIPFKIIMALELHSHVTNFRDDIHQERKKNLKALMYVTKFDLL